MTNKICIETIDDTTVLLTGCISSLINNRRANSLLRNSFDCMIESDRIVISNISDFHHCFDRINYLSGLCAIETEYSSKSNNVVSNYLSEEEKFSKFSQKALSIRNNECDLSDLNAFKNALIDNVPKRTLYDLQLLSAYHLAFSQNACNFSVPGAGKTSVVYGAYAYLKSLPEDDIKKIDRLLIIGPLSSFAPWEAEYEECFGTKVESKRLSGISLEAKKQYLYDNNPKEITLLAYQSVSPIVDELRYFLRKHRVMVVLDEAHKIKNTSDDSVYAQAVMSLAQDCKARVVLTGTPAPNGYEDLFNLFKFIWPNKKVIRFQIGQLKDMSKRRTDYRVDSLIGQISPYFIRVKKSDLKIPEATIHPPIIVPMGDKQREIYDFIERKYINDITNTNDKLFKSSVTKARIIRLMQAATNPLLLQQPLSDFAKSEGINISEVEEDNGILQTVLKYSSDEIPAKFRKAKELVEQIVSSGGKVVIWACYIKTIEYFSNFLSSAGIYNKILYGDTPVATDDIELETEEYSLTREAIIKEFNDMHSGLNVLIANPFAVAESISLHKACHNAIYLERSFNAAHFIQSKDRIHRYGLPNGTQTNYYYLVSKDSIDETINERLDIKEQRLIEIMENMPIPLFSNVSDNGGDEDVKAVLRDYARRIKT